MMRLFFCPTCTRVYYLPEEASYLCGRNHVPAIWADGQRRRFMISERSESNRPPWAIPDLVEEGEMFQQDFVENWLNECKHPENTEYGDYRRHFGYGTLGGKHLTRAEVMSKYAAYVLQPTQD